MRRPPCVHVDGILLLDKPPGLTSNQALQRAKRLFQACKAGHTGSLDPIASGLLPLCFGEATKLSRFLLDSDKRYSAVFELGRETTTYDTEGEVTATRPVAVTRAQVMEALGGFVGEIDQVPPVYSALKRGGRPLYELARAGVAVTTDPRRVRIDEIKVLDLRDERLELSVACSKGTYIRSLAHDLGRSLGCGAHVVELRRVQLGRFDLSQAVTFDVIEGCSTREQREALLLPGDAALEHLPQIRLSHHAAYYLRQGQTVAATGSSRGTVRVYEEDGLFLGLGEILEDGRLAPRRLLRSSGAP